MFISHVVANVMVISHVVANVVANAMLWRTHMIVVACHVVARYWLLAMLWQDTSCLPGGGKIRVECHVSDPRA